MCAFFLKILVTIISPYTTGQIYYMGVLLSAKVLCGLFLDQPKCGLVKKLSAVPWLVDWLRVPTPMRAIRVRTWVEVVGSVMEIFHFRVQWNARNISSRATLCECWEASSCQEANPMYEETNDSCLPACSCQEANPRNEETNDSLSEGELESSWPCSIQKYCRVQSKENSSPYSGEDGAD